MSTSPRKRFADGTSTTVSTSRDEIGRTLDRYGCEARAIIEEADQIVVMFKLDGWSLRVPVPIPPRPDARAKHRSNGTPLTATWEREVRRRWRVLLLLKSGLEAALDTDAGVGVERASAAYLVLPDNSIVAETVLPVIREARDTGMMPTRIIPSLPAPPSTTVIELSERTGNR